MLLEETERSGSVATVVISVACTVAAVLPSFLLGGLASLVREDLHFDEAGLGLAVGCFYAASSLTAIPGGRIAERLGARGGLALGMVLAVCSLGGIALLATSLARLSALLAVGGAANGLAQPAANLALARGVPAGRLGLAFGVKQSAVPAASLLAGIAVPLIGLTVGWRWAFAGGAVAALGLIGVRPGTGPATERAPRRPKAGRRLVDREQLPTLVRVALGSGLAAFAANSLAAFAVESAVSSGQRLALAGLLLGFGSVVTIVVRLVAGWMADRGGWDPLRVSAGMLLTGSAGYLVLGHVGGTAALVAGTVVAFGAGWGWPGLLQLAVVQDHMRAPAAASGITHAGALMGGLVGPITFGWTVAARGYTTAWTMAAAAALLAGGVLWWGRPAEEEARP